VLKYVLLPSLEYSIKFWETILKERNYNSEAQNYTFKVRSPFFLEELHLPV
jgi:hypothetical protein